MKKTIIIVFFLSISIIGKSQVVDSALRQKLEIYHFYYKQQRKENQAFYQYKMNNILTDYDFCTRKFDSCTIEFFKMSMDFSFQASKINYLQGKIDLIEDLLKEK